MTTATRSHAANRIYCIESPDSTFGIVVRRDGSCSVRRWIVGGQVFGWNAWDRYEVANLIQLAGRLGYTVRRSFASGR